MSIGRSEMQSKGAGGPCELVTVTVGGQLFGIPVLQVQDVLGPQRITRIPLAPAEIAGSLNLRGRIVTAIDVRVRLGLAQTADAAGRMSVVVDHAGELYSLLVDQVGEVLTIELSACERNPGTLDAFWRDVSAGIYKLEGQLLVVLDVPRLLGLSQRVSDAA
jgi:purine-binding chemotaxis protein CheW